MALAVTEDVVPSLLLVAFVAAAFALALPFEGAEALVEVLLQLGARLVNLPLVQAISRLLRLPLLWLMERVGEWPLAGGLRRGRGPRARLRHVGEQSQLRE